MNKETLTSKNTVIQKFGDSKKYWMSTKEYVGVIVGKEHTNSEYVISGGIIEVGGTIPNHYHKWEDQTFHIISGQLEVKIGDEFVELEAGDTVHCPRGIAHFMKNVGDTEARIISYIFPGNWAEGFMEETSKQMKSGKFDFGLIEDEYGVVYL